MTGSEVRYLRRGSRRDPRAWLKALGKAARRANKIRLARFPSAGRSLARVTGE